jgi:hypothetical protein
LTFGYPPDGLGTAAVNELAERSWVKLEWRHPRAHLPDGVPEHFRDVERVTTTFGRFRDRVLGDAVLGPHPSDNDVIRDGRSFRGKPLYLSANFASATF